MPNLNLLTSQIVQSLSLRSLTERSQRRGKTTYIEESQIMSFPDAFRGEKDQKLVPLAEFDFVASYYE